MLPPVTPRSDTSASPGPFTTQPIIDTSIGVIISSRRCSNAFTVPITSNSWREQVGHAIKLMPRERIRKDLRISKPTLISSTGSAANDTRNVSPIPSASNIPKPIADLTAPARAPPASVIPKCNGCLIDLASKR